MVNSIEYLNQELTITITDQFYERIAENLWVFQPYPPLWNVSLTANALRDIPQHLISAGKYIEATLIFLILHDTMRLPVENLFNWGRISNISSISYTI